VYVLPDNFFDIRENNSRFDNSATQKFTVPGRKVSIVTASKGLRVTINPAALELEDGTPVEGKINVSIIELTTSSDLFKSNAATLSNGRLLASGGSYFIGMESNGQKIRLKKDCSLPVDFPVLAKEEMELFYGERDSLGSMNWVKANDKLEQEFETIGFNTLSSGSVPVIVKPALKSKYHLFNKLDAKVYFMDKLMTLSDMVDEFKKRGIDKIIDTLHYTWYGGNDIVYSYKKRVDEGYRHGRQYRVISREELCKEKEEMEAANAEYKNAVKMQSQKDMTSQLKKYYAPATIGTLGWINCDRFYDKQCTDTELDIPITLNYSQIEYFIIFKSFNGLINKKIKFTAETKVILEKLPVGEAVTLIAFAKNKGVIYKGKEDFIIGRKKKIVMEFNTITPEELSNMFGKNVRI
jgi:hypothetical protein